MLGKLDQDARKRPHREIDLAHLCLIAGRVHPAFHVLQRGTKPTTSPHRLPQRRRLHHVHGLLLREQRLPRQPLHDPRPQNFGVERTPGDDRNGSCSVSRSGNWQWIVFELPHHEIDLKS